MEEYCVVTFQITSHAFIFEKAMKVNNLSTKLIPTPRQISSSCGMSAEVSCEELKEIEDLCKENIIEDIEIHRLERKRSRKLFR